VPPQRQFDTDNAKATLLQRAARLSAEKVFSTLEFAAISLTNTHNYIRKTPKEERKKLYNPESLPNIQKKARQVTMKK
jgi:hypothetical protein